MPVIQNEPNKIAATKRYKKRSMSAEVWRNFKKSKGAMLGIIILSIVLSACIVGEFIYDYNEDIVKQNFEERLQKPSWMHPFGTDQWVEIFLLGFFTEEGIHFLSAWWR